MAEIKASLTSVVYASFGSSGSAGGAAAGGGVTDGGVATVLAWTVSAPRAAPAGGRGGRRADLELDPPQRLLGLAAGRRVGNLLDVVPHEVERRVHVEAAVDHAHRPGDAHRQAGHLDVEEDAVVGQQEAARPGRVGHEHHVGRGGLDAAPHQLGGVLDGVDERALELADLVALLARRGRLGRGRRRRLRLRHPSRRRRLRRRCLGEHRAHGHHQRDD